MGETMEKPKHFDLTHFKAITVGGRKFVYCPIGNICSWSAGDYDHEFCAYCNIFYKGDMWPAPERPKVPA